MGEIEGLLVGDSVGDIEGILDGAVLGQFPTKSMPSISILTPGAGPVMTKVTLKAFPKSKQK